MECRAANIPPTQMAHMYGLEPFASQPVGEGRKARDEQTGTQGKGIRSSDAVAAPDAT